MANMKLGKYKIEKHRIGNQRNYWEIREIGKSEKLGNGQINQKN